MANMLIVSQVFFPDLTSVSQHLTDLADYLDMKGHNVVVYSSCRDYENPKISFPTNEKRHGISIRRLWQAAFSKNTRFGRVINFASFNLAMTWHLLFVAVEHYDLIIGTTVPPFLSFIGLLSAKLKRTKYCFYAMDLQPELSIVAGYLNDSSLVARLFMKVGDYIYGKADLVIALDRYMASHIIRRGAPQDRIRIVPIWPLMSSIYEGARTDNPFRLEMGFNDRIVVMYSGNMAVVHPLDTLLEAALDLRNDERFLFVFIGGGVRKRDVGVFKAKNGLANIIILPLQPRDQFHISLGSADLQVVIHGNGCTGYTHPNKIYGAMYIGKPVLYIGPEPSHVSEILENCPGNLSVRHGSTAELVEKLRSFATAGDKEWEKVGRKNREYALEHFSRPLLVGRLIHEIETIVN